MNETATITTSRRVSFSQFAQYQGCPYKYKLNYVDKVGKPDTSIHLIFGTAIHETIQMYLTKMYAGTQKAADELDLNTFFKDVLIKEFKKSKAIQKGIINITKDEMNEFYLDGVAILDWFKKRKNRIRFFAKKGYNLKGIELSLDVALRPGVKFVGYLDIVLEKLYDNSIIVIDLKTSTKGWNKYKKSNKDTTNQLLIYKKMYSDKYNVPLDKIDIEYHILRRKLPEDSEFVIPHISKFVPANGKPSINKAWNDFMSFVNTVFDETGNRRIDIPYLKNPTKLCDWCSFNDICDKKN